LDFDASTTTATGDFPKLGFEFVTVSGRENTVGLPIYIPRLDTTGGKLAGGNQQVVIPLAGVDGAEIAIAPNSVTLPDGSREGIIMFSQVQTDKTPMPAPDGVSFDLAWTLQPSGTHFNPPARVTLPNTSGGLPGQEYDMVTFDHGLGEWISMGPGIVSEDGSTVTSKLGYGIREAGWGGLCPPPDDTCNIQCNDKNECRTDAKKDCFCETTNKPDGPIGGNKCKMCKGGAEVNEPEESAPESSDLCKVCRDGELVNKVDPEQFDPDLSAPNITLDLDRAKPLTDAIESAIKTIGINVSVGLEAGVKFERGPCCNPDDGVLVEDEVTQAEGSVGLDIAIDGRIPGLSVGVPEIDFDIGGFSGSLDLGLGVKAKVGVKFTGSFGQRIESCIGDGEECAYGSLSVNFSPSLSAFVEAIACVGFDALGIEFEKCIGVDGNLTINFSGISYSKGLNVGQCSAGATGGGKVNDVTGTGSVKIILGSNDFGVDIGTILLFSGFPI